MCDFARTWPVFKPAQEEVALEFVTLEVMPLLVACYGALYSLPNPVFVHQHGSGFIKLVVRDSRPTDLRKEQVRFGPLGFLCSTERRNKLLKQISGVFWCFCDNMGELVQHMPINLARTGSTIVAIHI